MNSKIILILVALGLLSGVYSTIKYQDILGPLIVTSDCDGDDDDDDGGNNGDSMPTQILG
jgi:hypothetical protein